MNPYGPRRLRFLTVSALIFAGGALPPPRSQAEVAIPPQPRSMESEAAATAPRPHYVVVAPEATSSTEASAAATYLHYRALDFADIFTAKGGAPTGGEGGGAYLHLTILGQLGFVYFDGRQTGSEGRAAGLWRERRLQMGAGPMAYTRVRTRTLRGNGAAYEAGPWGAARERGVVRNGEWAIIDGRIDPFALGIEIQPGVLPGFEARVAPLEFVDFALGFLGLDIMTDDLPSGDEAQYVAGSARASSTLDGGDDLEFGKESVIELEVPLRAGASAEAERVHHFKAGEDVTLRRHVKLSVEENQGGGGGSSGFGGWRRRAFGSGAEHGSRTIAPPIAPTGSGCVDQPNASDGWNGADHQGGDLGEPHSAADAPRLIGPTIPPRPRSHPLPPPSELGGTEDVGN